ncbi:MAG: hypothetical protein QNJ31_01415 [Candidatus Caenarcaniphilales bacterium]|nr:hypothetical protein [Candidatus Caenarcaniphilales bacterium]
MKKVIKNRNSKNKKFALASLVLVSLALENIGTLASQDDLESQEIPQIQASPYSEESNNEVNEEILVEENNFDSSNQILSGEVVSINAGAYSPGRVDRGFTSASARVGDRGYLTLDQELNGIPKGSKVEFVVSSVIKAKRRFEKSGEIQLKAVKIVYPDGQTIPLNGEVYVVRDTSSTILIGEAKKKRIAKSAGKTAAGAATGALGGLIGSAIGGDASGRATAIGAGIGAGLGLLGAGLSKGEEVVVNSGDKLFLKFNKSMQLTPKR